MAYSKIKKDGTPARSPGRKAKEYVPRPSSRGPRPHVWKSGTDEYRHSMYIPWLKAKAQANFRGEGWELTFEQFYKLWEKYWEHRGRAATDYCMTRKDPEKAWTIKNSVVILRYEHLVKQAKIKANKGDDYYKKGPPGRPPKTISYDKLKVQK